MPIPRLNRRKLREALLNTDAESVTIQIDPKSGDVSAQANYQVANPGSSCVVTGLCLPIYDLDGDQK